MKRFGFLRRFFCKRKPKVEEKSNRYIRRGMHVRGTYYYNEALVKSLLVGERVKLIPEPDNPHDENAVMIFARGEKIGYVPREDNEVFVYAINQNKKIYAKITNIRVENGRPIVMFEASFSD